MAILMRRGLLEDFDPSKLRAGEWAVSIDAATERQLVYMCFAPGVVKRMGTYDDFSGMIAEIAAGLADEIAEQAKAELLPIKEAVEKNAIDVETKKQEIIVIEESIVNVYTPQILEWYNNTKELKESADKSASDAAESSKSSKASADDSAEFAQLSSDAADLSDGFAKLAESYAHGNGSREGDATDNARYYMEQAKAAAGGDYVARSEIGTAGGVASLDNTGKVPASQLPAISTDAEGINYNDEKSKLGAENVQDAIDTHVLATIKSENGVHGFRVNEDLIPQAYNAETGEWEDIAGGGGGSAKIDDVSGAVAIAGSRSVEIKWSDPTDVVVSGITIAEWGGTVVVRKAGSAPENRTDGTVVVDNKFRNKYASDGFVDTGLENDTTYYYRFFPYTTSKKFTDGTAVSATPTRVVVENVPTVSNALTYTGLAQSPIFVNYDRTVLDISGDVSAINAGSYAVAFTPKEDCVWKDGSTEAKTVVWSIEKAVVSIPSISGNFTYSGAQKNVDLSGIDTDLITISGVTSAINAGTYTVSFDLKDAENYKWSDGSNTTKSGTWSIAKASNKITLSAESVTLNAENPTATVTASADFGEISVTNNNPELIAVSGTTEITITGIDDASGTGTITVSVEGTSNYDGATATITVNAEFLLDGETVIPINDVQIWLKCDSTGRSASKNYTYVSQVISDTTILSYLMSDENAMKYLSRSTDFADAICASEVSMIYLGQSPYVDNILLNNIWCNAICESQYFESVLNVSVPQMYSNTQPNGTAFGGTVQTGDQYNYYQAFNKNGKFWANNRKTLPDYVGYDFEKPVLVKKFIFLSISSIYKADITYKIQGSNDREFWEDLTGSLSFTTNESMKYANENAAYTSGICNFDNKYYRYYRIYFINRIYNISTTTLDANAANVQFYGRHKAN